MPDRGPRAVAGLILVASLVAACAAPNPTSSEVAADPTASSPAPSPSAVPASPSSSPAGSPPASDPPVSAQPATEPPITPVPVAAAGLLGRLATAVDEATGDLALDLQPDVVAGAGQLDGLADDGRGPGRLFVVVSPPGSTAPDNLCEEADFVQGGTCEVVDLPGGDRAYRRGMVDFDGVRTVVVAIRLADGGGVLVEAGNFRFEAPPVLVAGEPRPTPELTRSDPVLTPDEAFDLARAVAEATRGCSLRSCP